MVYSTSGNLMGTVVQTGSFIPEFDIKDKYGKTVLKIQGPLIQMGILTDAEYKAHNFYKLQFIAGGNAYSFIFLNR